MRFSTAIITFVSLTFVAAHDGPHDTVPSSTVSTLAPPTRTFISISSSPVSTSHGTSVSTLPASSKSSSPLIGGATTSSCTTAVTTPFFYVTPTNYPHTHLSTLITSLPVTLATSSSQTSSPIFSTSTSLATVTNSPFTISHTSTIQTTPGSVALQTPSNLVANAGNALAAGTLLFGAAFMPVLTCIATIFSNLAFVGAQDTSVTIGTVSYSHVPTSTTPLSLSETTARTGVFVATSLPSLSSLGSSVSMLTSIETSLVATGLTSSTMVINLTASQMSTSTSLDAITNNSSTVSYTSTKAGATTTISSPHPATTTKSAAPALLTAGIIVLGVYFAPVLTCMAIIFSNFAFAAASPDLWPTIATIYEEALKERQKSFLYDLVKA